MEGLVCVKSLRGAQISMFVLLEPVPGPSFRLLAWLIISRLLYRIAKARAAFAETEIMLFRGLLVMREYFPKPLHGQPGIALCLQWPSKTSLLLPLRVRQLQRSQKALSTPDRNLLVSRQSISGVHPSITSLRYEKMIGWDVHSSVAR